jgi:hypothetical protein
VRELLALHVVEIADLSIERDPVPDSPGDPALKLITNAQFLAQFTPPQIDQCSRWATRLHALDFLLFVCLIDGWNRSD